jgi:hypothetical protein
LVLRALLGRGCQDAFEFLLDPDDYIERIERLDLNDFPNLGYFRADDRFDCALKRHRRRRTTAAGSKHLDERNAVSDFR